MKLPTIKNKNFKGKRVLLRVDFNVLLKNGKVGEDFRIKKTLPTIKLLQNKGAKIIILSHFGENKDSLRPVANYLKKRLKNFRFIPTIFGKALEKTVSQMKNGDILMLENLRINPDEEENDDDFAKKLASLGDFYINEAFSVSHRQHASIVGIPKYLPSFAGLLFEEEIENLSRAFKPKHPFLVILGGVKFESKLGVLERFLKIADKIFIGGALANNFFKLKGIDIDKSVYDEKVSIKKYLNNSKIVLPSDVRKEDGVILDIGPKSIKELSRLIKKAKFILWNGPLGNFEEKKFAAGTLGIARLIARSRAVSIVGGGETIAAATKAGAVKKFSFVSTGGGAMLQFLAKGTLPGIEALIRCKIRPRFKAPKPRGRT